MGLVPDTNPFAKLDKRSVIGILKATGSNDPDVLHAQKAKLLTQPKQLKLLGVISIVVGAFATITVFLAIFGIPAMIAGWWVWRFGGKNIEASEAGFAEYVGSGRPQVGPAAT